MKLSPEIRKKKNEFLLQMWVTMLLFLTCVVFLVLLAFRFNRSQDLTSQKLLTLSEESRAVLKQAAADGSSIRIAAVYRTGYEEKLVVKLLERYAAESSAIKTEVIDAEENPSALASYDLGDVQAVYNGSVIVACGNRVRILANDSMFSREEGQNLFNGEREITGAIRYVTAKELPKIYFTSGHGETDAGKNLTDAAADLSRNACEVNQLVLLQTGIPDDAAALAMVSPQQDINDEEKKEIIAYLEKGGSLMLFTDPFLTTNRDMLPNLNAVMNRYGIDISNNYAVEEDSKYHLTDQKMYLIPRFSTHEITAPIGNEERMVVLPVAKGLGSSAYDEKKTERSILLQSSDRSWSRNDMSNGSQNRTEKDIAGPLVLGFAAEKADDANTGRKSRIVVFGDSDFITDASFGIQANAELFMNSVNWLTGGEQENAIAGRELNPSNMNVRGDAFRRLMLICCVLLPLTAFLGAFIFRNAGRNR